MFYAGLALFFALHVFPFFDGARSAVVARIGVAPYRGIYSVVALTGLFLIVLGYDSGGNVHYAPIMEVRLAAPFVMLIAFTLFVASVMPGKLREIVRHPLTIAIALWAGLHALMNPDTHSLFLFGAFFVYAIASALSSEQRKKAAYSGGSMKYDGAAVMIGVILAAVVYRFHGAISGVPLTPM
jgi:uncharacterized membrane protein